MSLFKRSKLYELTDVCASLIFLSEYLNLRELSNYSNVFKKLWPNCTLPDKSSTSMNECCNTP